MLSNERLQSEAMDFIKAHKHELTEAFASEKTYERDERPVSVFMAGSPGAGKTEFSKYLLKNTISEMNIKKVIRIDPDEIRNMLPGYTGGNAHLFQKAIDRGVHILHDYALDTGKNFILDSTFSDKKRAYQNVERSLKRNRTVLIFYVYLDPFIAWDITKKRETIEGRNIPKEAFVNKLFAARDTVKSVQETLGDKIQVYLIKKRSIQLNDFDYRGEIDSIDKHLKITYGKEELMKKL